MQINPVKYPAPAHEMTPRNLSQITDLIIHHSDGPLTETPLDIDTQHRAQGWSMIGYNLVITPDGVVWQGRPDNVSPSAAYGRNIESFDICLIGQFDEPSPHFAPPTTKQLASLSEAIKWAHAKYPTIVRTIAHGDVAPEFYPQDMGDYSTACCGSWLRRQLKLIVTDLRQGK